MIVIWPLLSQRQVKYFEAETAVVHALVYHSPFVADIVTASRLPAVPFVKYNAVPEELGSLACSVATSFAFITVFAPVARRAPTLKDLFATDTGGRLTFITLNMSRPAPLLLFAVHAPLDTPP